jgi:hypothetical protein
MIRYAPLLALLLCSATPRTAGVRLLVPEGFRGRIVVVTGLPCGQAPTFVNGEERIKVPSNGIVILRDGLCYRDGHLGLVRDGAEVIPPPVDPTAPATPVERSGRVTREGSRYDGLTTPEIHRMKQAEFAFMNDAQEVSAPLERLTLTPIGKRLGADGHEADAQGIYGVNTGFWYEGEGSDRISYITYFVGEAAGTTARIEPEHKERMLAAVRACQGR